MVLAWGCVRPQLLGTVSAEEQIGLRAAAVEYLREAAFSDQPAIRMNAIEALGEVAPEEGLPCIMLNVENEYPGVSFAALMALGSLGRSDCLDLIRTRAEHNDPNVRIAALYALHRLGDRRRTGELSDYLLHNRDARVRANAALAIGRLEEPSSAKLLRGALKREPKNLAKLQLLEALAILGDKHAAERLIFDGRSAYPDQATLALGFLANARSPEAEDLFRDRLFSKDQPEVRMAAARGLGRLGIDDGLEMAVAHLWFKSPKKSWPKDPAEQQIARVRGLAAMALEAVGSPLALRSLKDAFERPGQSEYVRLAIARAAIRIIGLQQGTQRPALATLRDSPAGER
jgi:HEAT repeat protein